jgi:long-subunit acyl-CoA synthetase (AMP-forming)
MIVFRNGWNFNLTIYEHLIMSHMAVQNCILVGNGRDWPVAIIEIRSEFSTEEEKGNNDILESIWSRIKEANKLAISTGQLRRDRLIFAKKEKSFALTGKGTVQRKATIKMYKDEIDELYKSVGSEEGFKV